MGKKEAGLLERAINRTKKALEALQEREKRAREKWTKRYRRFMKATQDMAGLKNVATKKAAGLRDIIMNWPDETERLTKERDAEREAIRQKEEELHRQETELAVLLERIRRESTHTDEIVDQVFALNDTVVQALVNRNDFLTAHVYKLLIDPDGKLRSQVTLTSSDGLRRVVALVSHITRIDSALAAEAQAEVQKFFDRFSADAGEKKDDTVRALIDILEHILIERVSFRVGSDLYRFLGIEIDERVFPELKRAQHLLGHSLRSEKTSSYVKLYSRSATDKPWVEVKLS